MDLQSFRMHKCIRKEQYNCHWWLLREEYGGVKPPVLRSELDLEAKYHVAANIPYIKKLMERGTSQPWQQVLQEVIGEGRLDGSALREFFRPLEEWLRNENLRNNEYVGWIYDGDYCKHSIETANLQVFGGFYNVAVQTQLASWLVLTISCLISALVRRQLA